MLWSAPAWLAAQAQPATVERSMVGRDDRMHIAYSDGKLLRIAKEEGQMTCSSPMVAADKRTVGWLVDYEYCCTSYPIPLMLVIFRSGKIVERLLPGMAIEAWSFWAGGKQVAFKTNTLHGDLAPYYQLRDIETHAVVGQWEGHLTASAPEWARSLER
jgi:hypothetical protein